VLTKLVAAAVAIVLLLAYLLPVVIKMKDAVLAGVLLIGIAFMVVDLVHSLRRPEE